MWLFHMVREHRPPSVLTRDHSPQLSPGQDPNLFINDQPVLGHSPRSLLSATAIPPSSLTMALSLLRVLDPSENLVKETNSSLQFCSDWLLGPSEDSCSRRCGASAPASHHGCSVKSSLEFGFPGDQRALPPGSLLRARLVK